MKFIKENKYLLIIFLILILIKISMLIPLDAPTAWNDNYLYSKMARSIYENHQEFNIHENTISIHYPPMYPLLLSPSYLFSNMETVYFFLRIINILLITSSLFAVYLISRQFLDKKHSLIAATLSSILPSFFIFHNYIMAENLLYPLFLFSFYFIYKTFTEKRLIYPIIAGLLIGISVITKFNAVAIILTVILTYLATMIKNHFKKRKFDKLLTKKMVITALFFLLIILIWFLRNYSLNMPMFWSGYGAEAASVATTGNYLIKFLIKFILYLSYLVLATGIVGFLFAKQAIINFLKENNKKSTFALLTIFSIISFLAIAANHSILNQPYQLINPAGQTITFLLLIGRIIGRYIELLLPLIIIFFTISITEKYKLSKTTKRTTLILSFIAGTLTLFSLFPVNNISLSFVGGLKYIFDYLVYNVSNFKVIFSFASLITFSLSFLITALIITKLKSRLIYILGIFLLLSSIVAYAPLYYNTSIWENDKAIQAGKDINQQAVENNLKDYNVFIDQNCCNQKLLKGENTVCEGQGHVTVPGFFIRGDITVDYPENINQENFQFSILC